MLMVIVTCLLTTRIKPAYLFAGAAFIGFQAGMIDLPTLAGNFYEFITINLGVTDPCFYWLGKNPPDQLGR